MVRDREDIRPSPCGIYKDSLTSPDVTGRLDRNVWHSLAAEPGHAARILEPWAPPAICQNHHEEDSITVLIHGFKV